MLPIAVNPPGASPLAEIWGTAICSIGVGKAAQGVVVLSAE
jgi:hypothetical protein